MDFKDLGQFNKTLLAKQGWRIINFPDSLLAKVLKAEYFPRFDFLNSRLGNSPSFTWGSVWFVKGVLRNGLC